MKRVAIVSDSTCDLSKELIEANDIYIIPLYVNFKNKSFKDGVDIGPRILYNLVEEEGELPKTAAASPQDFSNVFGKLLAEYEEVFYTGISSKMSSTLQNAILARNLLEAEDRIFLLDSMNLSTGIGLLLLKACKFRDAGMGGAEILERLSKIVPQVRSQFVIPTLDYLYKGGRCNALSHFFGKVFKIKPVIVVRNGTMDVGKKPRGNMHYALDKMLEYLAEDLKDIDRDCIFITDSIAPDSNAYLTAKVKEMVGDIPIHFTTAGCVISSHCGEGTIGVLYIKKVEE